VEVVTTERSCSVTIRVQVECPQRNHLSANHCHLHRGLSNHLSIPPKHMKYFTILFCAFWLTTQQAVDLAYNSPQLWGRFQDCERQHREEWHYTDKCISRAFPKKTLLVNQECTLFNGRGGCVPVVKLIRNGQFVYN